MNKLKGVWMNLQPLIETEATLFHSVILVKGKHTHESTDDIKSEGCFVMRGNAYGHKKCLSVPASCVRAAAVSPKS